MAEHRGRVAEIAADKEEADGPRLVRQRPAVEGGALLRRRSVVRQADLLRKPVIAGRKAAAGVAVPVRWPRRGVGGKRGPQLGLRMPPAFRREKEVLAEDFALPGLVREMKQLQPGRMPCQPRNLVSGRQRGSCGGRLRQRKQQRGQTTKSGQRAGVLHEPPRHCRLRHQAVSTFSTSTTRPP
jgi:hypothetical protein